LNYLLDTNHWSFLQRGETSVVEHVRRLPSTTRLFMPVIVQAELLAGIESVSGHKRQDELRRRYNEVLHQSAGILVIDSGVATHFASIYAQLRRAGQPIGVNDIWIAATAFAFDMILVSSDPDFHRIPLLRLENWLSA
jgi:tRNA(fMet)-specific endonuclease VapC